MIAAEVSRRPLIFASPAAGAKARAAGHESCGFCVFKRWSYRASGPSAFFQASMPPWIWQAVFSPASCAACTAMADRSPKAQSPLLALSQADRLLVGGQAQAAVRAYRDEITASADPRTVSSQSATSSALDTVADRHTRSTSGGEWMMTSSQTGPRHAFSR